MGFVSRASSLGKSLEATRRRVEFVTCDVRIAADGREVAVPEIVGDETGVAKLLPKPRGGGVPERVSRDRLLESGSRRCTVDDRCERRLLEPTTGEPAEDRVLRSRAPLGPKSA